MVVTLWIALIVGVLLLLLILAQGRLYWKTEISRLALAGDRLEIMVARWVGRGRVFTVHPAEAANWRAVSRAEADDKRVPNIKVTIGGRDYDMSMSSPTTVDPEGLSQIAPTFFGALAAEYPGLRAKPAAVL